MQNPIQIRAIDHIVIRTENLRILVKFYGEVLGCPVERELSPDLGLVQMRAGNSLVDLVDVNGELGRMGGPAPGRNAHNLDHFCLEIDGMEESMLLEWLDQHGVEHGGFDRRYGANGFGRSVYLQDPDGNTVELKLAAGTSPAPG